MIKVIKPGKNPYEITCNNHNCECRFSFDKFDIKKFNNKMYVKCPECKKDIQVMEAEVETEEDTLTASQLVYKTIGQGYVFVKSDVANSYGELLPCGLKKFPVRIENLNGEICIGLIHNSIHKGPETIKHLFITDYKELWWLKFDKSM